MKKKIIIFDFDGVIVSSMQLCYRLNQKDIPDLEYSEWQSWFEGNFYKSIRPELSGEDYQLPFFEKYNRGVVEILPVEGIKKVIEDLAQKFTLTIISSGTRKAIEQYLKKYDLSSFFEEILAREIHHGKVEKIHMILDRYKVEPTDTLMVTDTVGDIKEAHIAGIKSLGVIWGVHDQEKLTEVSPHFIATNPDEIIAGVKQILK